jgi:hypothetical protein
MSEYLTVLLYVSVWMILYHLFIIPRTAQQAFEVWQQRLEDERNLIVDITEPVIEVIDDLLTSKFQSFFGSVSQLGQRAKELNPSSKMVDAVKSGDLYNVLGEYISNKAGLGDISDIIKTQIKPEEGQNETKWKF